MTTEPGDHLDIDPTPIDEQTLGWAMRAVGSHRAEFTAQELQIVASTVRRVRARAGVEIFRAGELATHVFLLRSGTVELRRPFDHRQGVLASLAPGGVFGDVPTLLTRPHHLDAVATVDSDLLMMRSQDLLRHAKAIPAFALFCVRSLASRVFELHQRLDEMLAGHLDYRVAALLARKAGPTGRVDVTQDQVARLLGVQRSSINDAVKRLEQRNFLTRGYGYIQVIEPQRLTALLRP